MREGKPKQRLKEEANAGKKTVSRDFFPLKIWQRKGTRRGQGGQNEMRGDRG